MLWGRVRRDEQLAEARSDTLQSRQARLLQAHFETTQRGSASREAKSFEALDHFLGAWLEQTCRRHGDVGILDAHSRRLGTPRLQPERQRCVLACQPPIVLLGPTTHCGSTRSEAAGHMSQTQACGLSAPCCDQL